MLWDSNPRLSLSSMNSPRVLGTLLPQCLCEHGGSLGTFAGCGPLPGRPHTPGFSVSGRGDVQRACFRNSSESSTRFNATQLKTRTWFCFSDGFFSPFFPHLPSSPNQCVSGNGCTAIPPSAAGTRVKSHVKLMNMVMPSISVPSCVNPAIHAARETAGASLLAGFYILFTVLHSISL